MAKHRAPVVKRQRLRRTVRKCARLAFGGLRLSGLVTIGVLAVSARVLRVVGWLVLVVSLGTLSLAGGRDAAPLRRWVMVWLVAPARVRVAALLHRLPTRAPVEPASAPVEPCAPLPVVVDPDPSLWPPMGQLTDTWDDEDDETNPQPEVESLGVAAIRGLRAQGGRHRA